MKNRNRYWVLAYRDDSGFVEWAHEIKVYSHKWKAEVRRKNHILAEKIKPIPVTITPLNKN